MSSVYDQYYQTENLFGHPFPELIDFFTRYPGRGSVLDLGCGQGRNSIPLARLGYQVLGLDLSKVGIEQMNQIARKEGLPLEGRVEDLYLFSDYATYDMILLDSMFHFTKKDQQTETDLILRIMSKMKVDGLLVVCLQDTGQKVPIFQKILETASYMKVLLERELVYEFQDPNSNHRSTSPYKMMVYQKVG